MLGVKIIIMIMVISIVWHIIVNAMISGSDPATRMKILDKKNPGPWWYSFDGFLILVDLFGLIYIAAYFLFVFIK